MTTTLAQALALGQQSHQGSSSNPHSTRSNVHSHSSSSLSNAVASSSSSHHVISFKNKAKASKAKGGNKRRRVAPAHTYETEFTVPQSPSDHSDDEGSINLDQGDYEAGNGLKDEMATMVNGLVAGHSALIDDGDEEEVEDLEDEEDDDGGPAMKRARVSSNRNGIGSPSVNNSHIEGNSNHLNNSEEASMISLHHHQLTQPQFDLDPSLSPGPQHHSLEHHNHHEHQHNDHDNQQDSLDPALSLVSPAVSNLPISNIIEALVSQHAQLANTITLLTQRVETLEAQLAANQHQGHADLHHHLQAVAGGSNGGYPFDFPSNGNTNIHNNNLHSDNQSNSNPVHAPSISSPSILISGKVGSSKLKKSSAKDAAKIAALREAGIGTGGRKLKGVDPVTGYRLQKKKLPLLSAAISSSISKLVGLTRPAHTATSLGLGTPTGDDLNNTNSPSSSTNPPTASTSKRPPLPDPVEDKNDWPLRDWNINGGGGGEQGVDTNGNVIQVVVTQEEKDVLGERFERPDWLDRHAKKPDTQAFLVKVAEHVKVTNTTVPEEDMTEETLTKSVLTAFQNLSENYKAQIDPNRAEKRASKAEKRKLHSRIKTRGDKRRQGFDKLAISTSEVGTDVRKGITKDYISEEHSDAGEDCPISAEDWSILADNAKGKGSGKALEVWTPAWKSRELRFISHAADTAATGSTGPSNARFSLNPLRDNIFPPKNTPEWMVDPGWRERHAHELEDNWIAPNPPNWPGIDVDENFVATGMPGVEPIVDTGEEGDVEDGYEGMEE